MAGLQRAVPDAHRPYGERCLPASAVAIDGGRGGELGETLFGLTSVSPTNVTPSSMASLEERMSPNSSALDLISILSLAVTLPLIFPRTITDPALTLPLMTAESPRVSVPSELISPSSLPSKVN